MGEPLVGDIASPVDLVTVTVKLKKNITGKKGDFLQVDGTNDFFTVIPVTATGAIAVATTNKGIVQVQEDFISDILVDGVTTVAAYAWGSTIYAQVAVGINPGQIVDLQVLVDDTPGPAVVGFGIAATKSVATGRFLKVSGDDPAIKSTGTLGSIVGIIRTGDA